MGSSFSLVPVPSQPLAHEHTLALLDRANFPLSRTLCPLRPHSLSGRDIADWAPGLGIPSPLYSSLWLPIKGPGRAPLALKGAQAPFTLTCPLHCTGSSSRCGQDAPNQPMSHQVQLTPTFLPSPPCLVPALGWTVPLGHRKEGRRGLSPPPHLLSL